MRTLREEVLLPCIAHWQQKHFVVVYKLTNKHVHVADQAFGLIKYTRQEFMSGWLNMVNPDASAEGILLLLDTTPEFYAEPDLQQQRPRSLADRLNISGF
jgi:ATP-binding cassette subfamily B protein